MKVTFSTRSDKTRIDSVDKFLARNRDAILVKLEGTPDASMTYTPGHVCGIEECDDGYNVYVGKHLIGQLPDEAVTFAEQVDLSPEFLVAIVGKVEENAISIYIAE